MTEIGGTRPAECDEPSPPGMNPPPTKPLLLPFSERLTEWLKTQPDVRGVENLTDWDSFFIGFVVETEDGWHEYFLMASGPDQPGWNS